jgi:hypothetical protein
VVRAKDVCGSVGPLQVLRNGVGGPCGSTHPEVAEAALAALTTELLSSRVTRHFSREFVEPATVVSMRPVWSDMPIQDPRAPDRNRLRLLRRDSDTATHGSTDAAALDVEISLYETHMRCLAPRRALQSDTYIAASSRHCSNVLSISFEPKS